MKRAYYSNKIQDFLLESDSSVLGELTANHSNRTLAIDTILILTTIAHNETVQNI